jgi:N-acetylglucosaminyldiphosphoundecaprenol N-acetyl-beta-D-mannosaminyltransferase
MTTFELPRHAATPSAAPLSLARPEVVNVPVDPLSMADVVDTVLGWTDSRSVHTAVGVNAAVCNLASRDAAFRELVHDADLAYADGQSVVWAARALGTHVPERVATTDLVYPLVRACAEQGKRVYLYGGRPEVIEAAAIRLRAYAPKLELRFHHGFEPQSHIGAVLDEINDFGTDVLLVGLGDPLQQEWIARHRDRLTVPAILTCGGLFDWTSGSRRRAPSWMIIAGLEWLWRLILEPRRLARRYLVGNPEFLARLAVQRLTGHGIPRQEAHRTAA